MLCDIVFHCMADIINTAPVFYIYFTGKNRTVMAETLEYGFNMYFVFRQNGCIGILNNPVPVSLLSGDRKPQIRFLGNHNSGSGNLYHKSFRM